MAANIIVDLLLAVIIGVGVVLGIKRGFFYTATKPIKWFSALLLAVSLSSTVASGIIQPIIEEPITNQISNYLIDKCEGLAPSDAKAELPTLLKFAANIADINISDINGESTREFISNTVDKLASPAIYLISVILAFFAIYFISKILLAILFKLLNGIFKTGVIGVLNKILGGVLGLFLAFVAVWLLVIIFGYVINLPAIAKTGFAGEFDGGVIYRFIKSMSPLDLLLSF